MRSQNDRSPKYTVTVWSLVLKINIKKSEYYRIHDTFDKKID